VVHFLNPLDVIALFPTLSFVKAIMSSDTLPTFDQDETYLEEEKGLLTSRSKIERQFGTQSGLSWFWVGVLVTSVAANVLWLVFLVFRPRDIAYENVISKYGQ
jgi:hypothetical protein